MYRNELARIYFEWLCQLVLNENISKKYSHTKLMRRLHEIEFTYILDLDGNREEDGMDLRYRFGYEHGYENSMIASLLDDRGCSVLEMMVALCIRVEEHIMADQKLGDRTGKWFWDMIVNLGLHDMDNDNFNEGHVDRVIHRLLNREYGKHGEGGLVTVNYNDKDMRTVEIWYQMSWYLDSFI